MADPTPKTQQRQRGRPPVDVAARERSNRRRVLERGLLACYEIIDQRRKEMAELDRAEKA